MHVQELFDSMPYVEVIEESVMASQITFSLAVTLCGPTETISAELRVFDALSGEQLWCELLTEYPLTAGGALVASIARRGLERATRQLSPF